MQIEGEAWALIPARGGSKGIPRKNLLSLCGRPLIAYSIEHALACPRVSRTIVSTDDAEIAEVALAAGAEVPFVRPAQYATDTATDLDVFSHALSWFADQEGAFPEYLVHLRPTGPVRSPHVIETALRQLIDTPKADALRSVSLVLETPYKMWRIEEGLLTPLLTLKGVKEAHSAPRQELPPAYLQNGIVDVIRASTILEKGSMCGSTVVPLITEGDVVDLDHPGQIPEAIRVVERHQQASRTSP